MQVYVDQIALDRAYSQPTHPAHESVVGVLVWHFCAAKLTAQPCTAWELLHVTQPMNPPELVQLNRFTWLNRQGAFGAIEFDLGVHSAHRQRPPAQ